MGSSDSLSLASEPPDIGNWFSSYVYESPELNTIDGFEDSTDSIVAETEEWTNESKQELDGNIILARSDDLPLDGKEISGVKSPNRDDNYMTNGLKYSDSSLGSEPLDVRKWFSSYVYESPVIDTSYEFRSDHKENDANCVSKEQEVTLSNSIGTGKDDSEDENIPSYGLVECVNFVEDTKNENTYISKDSQKDNGIQNSTKLIELTTHWSSDPTSLKKIMQDQGNSLATDSVVAGSSLGKLRSELNPEVSHALLNITSDSPKKRGKSAQESFPSWVHREEGSKAEDSTKGIGILVSAENIEIDLADAKPVKKFFGNADKENNTELAGNGFISTRQSRSIRVGEENSLKRSFDVKSNHVKNGIIISQCSSEEVITGRKVLSETTNFQPCNWIEVTGKWKCPQKSKPNLGPPLKQLRLEQWLRRV